MSRFTPCCLLLALAACGPAATPANGPSSQPSGSSSAPVLPNEAPPLLLEYVTIHRVWVERVLPVPPEAATSDAAEQAYRSAHASELATKLATDLTARFRSNAPARAAIADATLAVLGDRAASDAARPTAHVIVRANVEQARLPAAAKAALSTFARGAHPGDVLSAPAVDGDAIVVARARAPGAE